MADLVEPGRSPRADVLVRKCHSAVLSTVLSPCALRRDEQAAAPVRQEPNVNDVVGVGQRRSEINYAAQVVDIVGWHLLADEDPVNRELVGISEGSSCQLRSRLRALRAKR